MTKQDDELVAAMRERARIRRSIPRGEPDRISDQLEQAAAAIAALTAERDGLADWVSDLQSGMFINCVYCGHRYGPNDGHLQPDLTKATVTVADALTVHISKCQKHPLAKAESRLAAQAQEIAELRAKRDKAEAALAEARKERDGCATTLYEEREEWGHERAALRACVKAADAMRHTDCGDDYRWRDLCAAYDSARTAIARGEGK